MCVQASVVASGTRIADNYKIKKGRKSVAWNPLGMICSLNWSWAFSGSVVPKNSQMASSKSCQKGAVPGERVLLPRLGWWKSSNHHSKPYRTLFSMRGVAHSSAVDLWQGSRFPKDLLWLKQTKLHRYSFCRIDTDKGSLIMQLVSWTILTIAPSAMVAKISSWTKVSRPINNVVDAQPTSSCFAGQPMHAFDEIPLKEARSVCVKRVLLKNW